MATDLDFIKRLNAQRKSQFINEGQTSVTDWSAISQSDYGETPGNWAQQISNNLAQANEKYAKGFFGAVEKVGDFALTAIGAQVGLIGGLFSAITGQGFESGWNASTTWAKEAVKADWSTPVANAAAQLENLELDLVSGQVDKWANQWSHLTEQTTWHGKEAIGGENNILGQASEMVGSVLPSIGLAVATGGTSELGTAAKIGIRAGVAAAEAAGGATQTALNEGASFENAIGYGAAKGSVAGVANSILGTFSVNGGSLLQKGAMKAGESVLSNLVGQGISETAATGFAKATEIAVKAFGDGAYAALNTAVDPVLKQITYDSEALSKAYGTDEARENTLKNIGVSAATAAALSSVMQAIPETAKRIELGKEGYTADYLADLSKSHTSKAEGYMRKALKAENEAEANRYVSLANGEYIKASDYAKKVFDWADGANIDAKPIAGKAQETVQSVNKAKAAIYQMMKERKANSASYEGGSSFSTDGSGNGTYTDASGRKFSLSVLGNKAVYSPNSVARGVTSFSQGTSIPSDYLRISKGNVNAFAKKPFIENLLDDGYTAKDIADIGEAINNAPTSYSSDGKIKFRVNLQAFSEPDEGKALAVVEEKPIVVIGRENEDGSIEVLDYRNVRSDERFSVDIDGIKAIANSKDGKVVSYSAVDRAVRDFIDVTFNDRLKAFIGETQGPMLTDSLSRTKFKVSIKSSKKALTDTLFKEANLSGKEAFSSTLKKALLMSDIEVSAYGKKESYPLSDLGDTSFLDEYADEIAEAIFEKAPESNLNRQIEKAYSQGEKAVRKAEASYGRKLDKALAKLAKRTDQLIREHMARMEQKRISSSIAKIDRARFRIRRIFEGENLSVPRDIEELLNNQGKALLSPFSKVHTSGGTIRVGDFVAEMEKFAEAYTPENFDGTAFGFNETFRNELDIVLDELSAADGPITSEQAEMLYQLYKDSVSIYQKAKQKAIDNATASATAEIQHSQFKLSKAGRSGLKGKLKQDIEKGIYQISSPNEVLRNLVFGPGILADKVDEIVYSVDDRNAFVFQQGSIFDSKLASLGFNNKKMEGFVNVGNYEMSFEDAILWYANLTMPEDTNNYAYAKNGFSFTNKDGKKVQAETRTEPTEDYSTTIEELREAFGADLEAVDGFVEWLKKDFFGNDGVYDMVKELTGATDKNPDAGLSKKGEYLPVSVDRGKGVKLNAGKVVGRFSNKRLIRRKAAGKYLLDSGKGLRGTVREWIEDMGTSYYIMPKINDFEAAIQGVYGQLNSLDKQVIKNFVGQAKGTITRVSSGYVGNTMALYRTSMPSTWFKQPASIFAAGISPNAFTKYIGVSLANSVKMNKEYAGAWEKACKMFPSLETRGKEKVQLTGNGFTRAVGKAAGVMSAGTTAFDNATIKTIVFITLNEVKAELGADTIDSDAVVSKAIWRLRERVTSQISGNQSLYSPNQMGGTISAPDKGNALSKITRPFTGAATAWVRNMERQLGEAFHLGGIKQENQERLLDIAESDLKKSEEELNKAKQASQEADDEFEKAIEERRSLKEESDKDKGNQEKRQAYEKAKEAEKKAKEGAKAAADELNRAEQENIRAKAKRDARKDIFDKVKAFNAKGGRKAAGVQVAAGMLALGLYVMGVDEINARIKGKKKWNDWDVGDMAIQTALNSSFNSVPVARTFVSFLQNGYEPADPSYEAITAAFSAASSVKTLFENGFTETSAKKAFRQLVEVAGMMTGFPAKPLYDYINGIVGNFNPEAAIAMKDVFYNVSYSSSANFNSAVESGDDVQASAYANSIMNGRVGEPSSELKEALVELGKSGETFFPSSIPTRYENGGGGYSNVSWSDQQEQKKLYSKANAHAAKLVKTTAYKSESAKVKASALRRLYNAFKAYATSKANPNYSPSVMSLLASVNDKSVSLISLAVSHIGELEASKTKTKKELAVSYVNTLSLSKAEKLLVLKLAGYSVDVSPIVSLLVSKGISRADAKKALGEK